MAVYDHEEQEQLEELKAWWKLHGNLVTAIVVALALAVVAWQGWNWWQRKQSGEASNIYAAVQRATAQHDAKRARDLAGELIDKYTSTTYAPMAAMLSARAQAEAGDLKNARVQLQWAADNARDDALRDLARLRLAVLLVEEKSYDEAVKLLAAEPASASFAARFNDLRGDVLALQGKPAEARAAYEAAIAKLAPKTDDGAAKVRRDPYQEMVQSKLEAAAPGGAAK